MCLSIKIVVISVLYLSCSSNKFYICFLFTMIVNKRIVYYDKVMKDYIQEITTISLGYLNDCVVLIAQYWKHYFLHLTLQLACITCPSVVFHIVQLYLLNPSSPW